MHINHDLEDNEVYELSRAQIMAIENETPDGFFSNARSDAGLRRDFKIPQDMKPGFIYGIDVSHWQGDIDWGNISRTGIGHAYVKATQGATFIDHRFKSNFSSAISNGLQAGCYHFLSANTGLQSQIDSFLRQYEPLHGANNLPPCMDIEWDYNSAGVDRWSTKSRSFVEDKSQGWMEGIELRLGVSPIFYTNKFWWQRHLGASNRFLNAFGVWMSRYGGYGNDAPDMMAGYRWVMWQFTDRASILGVSGGVDANLMASDFLGDGGVVVPESPVAIPDQPLAQSALSSAELASVFDRLRSKFSSLSSAQVEHLNILVNTSSPRDLRHLVRGSVEAPLSESEKGAYFDLARSVLGGGSLNQGQVDLLDILLRTASAQAVRLNLLRQPRN